MANPRLIFSFSLNRGLALLNFRTSHFTEPPIRNDSLLFFLSSAFLHRLISAMLSLRIASYFALLFSALLLSRSFLQLDNNIKSLILQGK